jgi:hypothetical protein
MGVELVGVKLVGVCFHVGTLFGMYDSFLETLGLQIK